MDAELNDKSTFATVAVSTIVMDAELNDRKS
jgi:hypothetical protein